MMYSCAKYTLVPFKELKKVLLIAHEKLIYVLLLVIDT